jgi:hypothetical protein
MTAGANARVLALAAVIALTAWGTMSRTSQEPPADHGPTPGVIKGPWSKNSMPAFAFSPDGRTFACDLALRDLVTGKELSAGETGPGHAECAYAAFSPDGRQLASVHVDRGLNDARHSICLWNVPARKGLLGPTPLPFPKRNVSNLYRDSLYYLTFSPEGRMLATRHPGDEAIVWETATGKERLRLATRGLAVAFGADGRSLVSVSRDGLVQHWDLATKELVAPGGDSGRKEFFFVDNAFASADGSAVALADGYSVVIKDARSGKTLRRFDDVPARRLALAAGGKTLAVEGEEGVALFDVNTGKEEARLSGAERPEFSPNGKFLAVAEERSVAVWDVDKLVHAARRTVKRDPPPLPLEATLISRQDAYTLDLGGKTPEEFARQINVLKDWNLPPAPKVDLVLTLRNIGRKELTFTPKFMTIDPCLVGDGAMNHPLTPYGDFFNLKGLGQVTLTPGATYSVPVKSLIRENDRRSYWLLPGEYSVHARCHLGVDPAPAGSNRWVTLRAPPLRVKVVAAKK